MMRIRSKRNSGVLSWKENWTIQDNSIEISFLKMKTDNNPTISETKCV